MAPFILLGAGDVSAELGELDPDVRCALLVGELLGVVTLVLGSLNCGLLGGRSWVGADGSVCLGVELLNVISSDLVLDVLRELALESSTILFLELLHVVSNVATEDVRAKDLSLELLALSVITSITGNAVGDGNSSINTPLEGGEHSGTSASALESSIQYSMERAGSILDGLNIVVLTIRLDLALVFISKTELGEGSASQQQANSVSCSVVGMTNGDSISGQLSTIGSSVDEVTLNLCAHHLCNNIPVGESDNKPVFRSVVLVLVLQD